MHHEYIKYIQSENKWNLSTIKNPEHRQKKCFLLKFSPAKLFLLISLIWWFLIAMYNERASYKIVSW